MGYGLKIFFTGVFAGMVVFMVLSTILGKSPSQLTEYWQTQAIEHGHAEWVVTGPDGSTEFRWKEPPQQESEVHDGE